MIETTLKKLEEKKKNINEEFTLIYSKFNQNKFNSNLEKEFDAIYKEKRMINEEISILEKALTICKKYQ